jgi:adenosine deaminase
VSEDRLRRLPKAELHCHLEGTASPALVRAQAARHGVDVSGLVDGGRYRWRGFGGFLDAYDRASALFRTPEDYADLAEDHLSRIAADGAIYAELFVSPDHAEAGGLSADAYVAAAAEGARRAQAAHAIHCRLVVVGVRHRGAQAVERAARFAAARPPLVTGFGLAGDERVGDPADFARAFATAREAGLGLTAHAGEFRGPDAVRRTLDALRPSRLGHGVRAIEDTDLVGRIAGESVVLEVCSGSNLALGVCPDAASHPLRRLREAGCRVTVGSDDPPFFETSLLAEYRFARDRQGFGDEELLQLTRTALEAAFVDEATRAGLLARLAGSAADALGATRAGD